MKPRPPTISGMTPPTNKPAWLWPRPFQGYALGLRQLPYSVPRTLGLAPPLPACPSAPPHVPPRAQPRFFQNLRPQTARFSRCPACGPLLSTEEGMWRAREGVRRGVRASTGVLLSFSRPRS